MPQFDIKTSIKSITVPSIPALNVRNLPEAVHHALRRRAAFRNGT
ncbi:MULTISPECIES: FitA-like ribbon-helix-helix domain-containing protein [Acidiphilium]|nr:MULTISPECIES: hypothetical protein [Acidiphilium]HQT86880.1 hypothetical protein [Acidiphilium rubrum]